MPVVVWAVMIIATPFWTPEFSTISRTFSVMLI